MATSAVGAVDGASRTTVDRGLSALGSEDFFKILLSELQNQDPFEPAKTSEMVGQISQIRSIELSKYLTDALQTLTAQQHTAGASELLGKYVTARVNGQDGTETEVAGIVTGVRFASDGTAILELDTGQTVLASDVTRIAAPETAEVPAADQQDAAAETAEQQAEE